MITLLRNSFVHEIVITISFAHGTSRIKSAHESFVFYVTLRYVVTLRYYVTLLLYFTFDQAAHPPTHFTHPFTAIPRLATNYKRDNSVMRKWNAQQMVYA